MSKPTYEELEARLKTAERKNELYETALRILKKRHFPHIQPPEFKDTWKDGKPIPGESFMHDAREAFALLDPKHLAKKL